MNAFMEPDQTRRRLLDLAHARNLGLAELSRLIGRNPTYLQQFVKKGSPRKLDENDRRTLARFFAVNETELGAAEVISFDEQRNSRRSEWVNIPRLAIGASAGPGAVGNQEEAIGAFRFSSRWLRDQGLDPASLSAIAVAGDSMEATLRDGDEILVDRRAVPPRDGVHVVRVDDAVLVKRLETGRPGVITLISDNPAYRPIALTPGDLQVIGRVVWKSGRL